MNRTRIAPKVLHDCPCVAAAVSVVCMRAHHKLSQMVLLTNLIGELFIF